ncbi:acetyltransferase [Salinimicrobium sp. CDJ15-81-2]|nr:acetyltransferase [Salinimicrobium nanhaiense]
MVLVGASGHAREILDVVQRNRDYRGKLSFFDNVSPGIPDEFLGYPIIKKLKEVEKYFLLDKDFILALGGTARRFEIARTLRGIGGNLVSLIADSSEISRFSELGRGLNIMPFSSILGNAILKDGVLLNSYASIHHDSEVGMFSEISPGARILGNCKIGNFCSIGSNAVILPGVEICEHVIIGAGAVVTKDIKSEGTYVGTPAKKVF